MSEISAEMVKRLRDATGAGMMDCKRALVETGGDHDAAVTHLRERGMASAAKRAGRETREGRVLARVAGGRGALVAVGCETEPVSKNEEFIAYAEAVLEAAFAGGDPLADAGLEQRRVELVARIGENIEIRGARTMDAGEGEELASYVHLHKKGALVKVRGAQPELAKQLAMHVVSERPAYATRDQVPAELVAAEREIFANSDEVLGKPEQVREQIVEGMVNKRFYAVAVLADQVWIHDSGQTVAKALAAGGLELVDYAWLSVD